MKTGDLVKQFGVSDTTIRRWVAEFGEYLSSNAQQIHSKHRSFTADDFLVLATIHVLSKEGYSLSAINDKLGQGYRVEDVSAATVGYTDGRMVPATAIEQIIDAAEIRVELESLKIERDRLLDELGTERQRNIEKDQRIEQLQKDIRELQRELGRAEGELSYRRELENRDKPSDT
jgi:DNA-binding transcriptional MerR regulator